MGAHEASGSTYITLINLTPSALSLSIYSLLKALVFTSIFFSLDFCFDFSQERRGKIEVVAIFILFQLIITMWLWIDMTFKVIDANKCPTKCTILIIVNNNIIVLNRHTYICFYILPCVKWLLTDSNSTSWKSSSSIDSGSCSYVWISSSIIKLLGLVNTYYRVLFSMNLLMLTRIKLGSNLSMVTNKTILLGKHY